jgi:6-phosphogluconolactonase (cycloisomerase 2 family)
LPEAAGYVHRRLEGSSIARLARIGAWAVGVVVSLSLVAADHAWAGPPIPLGCIDDDDENLNAFPSPQSPDPCPQSVDALDGVVDTLISSDGDWLYAAASGDAAITWFRRDHADGSLAWAGCVDDEDPRVGLEECAATSNVLDGVRELAMSPDGAFVYASVTTEYALAEFARDQDSGQLTYLGCIGSTRRFPDSGVCHRTAPALQSPTDIALTADGATLYVASHNSDAIGWFDRNPVTGRLSYAGCVEGNHFDWECPTRLEGLNGASRVALSPDDHNVYASGFHRTIMNFARESDTGDLAFVDCVDKLPPDLVEYYDCDQRTEGLNERPMLAFSADGRHVYAATGHAVRHLHRDPSTGSLSPAGCVRDTDAVQTCASATTGLDTAWSIAISPDGTSVHALARNFPRYDYLTHDDTFTTLRRDRSSGEIHPAGCIDDLDAVFDPDWSVDCPQSVHGLRAASSITFAPDGRTLYVAGGADDAIAIFGVGDPNDWSPPETWITSAPAGTVDQAPTFGFASDEKPVRFECRLDDGSFGPCSGPAATHTPEADVGSHRFEVRAIDAAGNLDATPATETFAIAAPPTPDAGGPPTGDVAVPAAPWPTASPPQNPPVDAPSVGVWKIRTNDSARSARIWFGPERARVAESEISYQCSLDRGAMRPCESPRSYRGLERGRHRFRVFATNQAGASGPSTSARFRIR